MHIYRHDSGRGVIHLGAVRAKAQDSQHELGHGVLLPIRKQRVNVQIHNMNVDSGFRKIVRHIEDLADVTAQTRQL